MQKTQIQQVPSNTPGAIEALEITSSSNYVCKLLIKLPLKAPPTILDVFLTTIRLKVMSHKQVQSTAFRMIIDVV